MQLANLLGVQHPKSLFKVEFTRFMAQPFMQLHSKWMKVRGGAAQHMHVTECHNDALPGWQGVWMCNDMVSIV
jgi:hypothetical protein